MSERPKIIAIDFDDTLFRYVPPKTGKDYSGRPGSIGKPDWYVINAAKKEKARGAVLILWTCREGLALEQALAACDDVDLHFDCVNCNHSSTLSEDWPDCRKVKADEYWDDRDVSITDVYRKP